MPEVRKVVQTRDVEHLRKQLVKEMLDQFPKLRKWIKSYLTVYG